MGGLSVLQRSSRGVQAAMCCGSRWARLPGVEGDGREGGQYGSAAGVAECADWVRCSWREHAGQGKGRRVRHCSQDLAAGAATSETAQIHALVLNPPQFLITSLHVPHEESCREKVQTHISLLSKHFNTN